MLDNIEFILKIIFIIMSFMWIGKIMILRSDKQVVINPLLIGIGAILAVFPQSNINVELFGIEIQTLKVILYFIYIVIVLFGFHILKRKDGVF